MRLRTSEVADLAGGAAVGPEVVVDGACTDSRLVRGGELFVALPGRRDGSQFVGDALEAGAVAWLGQGEPSRARGPAVLVDDPAAALTRLATGARRRLCDRVVGITGSVGKTSTKDLLAAALAGRWRVSASPRSFNNEIGVPLTILSAPEETEALVVEMGARGPGHIADLCRVAGPRVGVVTTVGVSHAESFGGPEEVARAKGELVEALPADGAAVLNAEVPLVSAMAARTRARVLTFGTAAGDVRAEGLTLDPELRPRFRLWSPWGHADVALAVRGRHQAANALAAAACALFLGVDVDQVAAGLGRGRLSPWRMQLDRAPSGLLVLNDAYNSNPLSAEAALRALAELPARRRSAVLGVMAELGDRSAAEHARIGRLAAELGIRLIAVATPDYGADENADTAAEALARLGPLGPGDAVLVKASRAAGLEAAAARLAAS